MTGRRWPNQAFPALVLALALLVTPGCSRLINHFNRKTPTRTGTLTVTPPSGPPGTAFTLVAGALRPGEAMNFEVDPPNRTKFVGPSHTAGPDGKVSTTYTAQTGDPPGTYVVKVTGTLGTRAQGSLVVTAAGGP